MDVWMQDLLAAATTLRAWGKVPGSGGFARRLASFGSATKRRCTTCSGDRPFNTIPRPR
jgi:hypothetical protein